MPHTVNRRVPDVKPATPRAERGSPAGEILPMSREDLHEAGTALHGERWQNALARDIPISDRMMRHMAAGNSPVSDRTAARIDELLDLKAEAVAAVRRKRGRVT